MAKKTHRSKKSRSIAEALLGLHAVIQIAQPYAPAIERAAKGDIKGAVDAVQAVNKDENFKNIGEAATPFVALGLGKKAAGWLGLKSPKFGKKWRLF